MTRLPAIRRSSVPVAGHELPFEPLRVKVRRLEAAWGLPHRNVATLSQEHSRIVSPVPRRRLASIGPVETMGVAATGPWALSLGALTYG